MNAFVKASVCWCVLLAGVHVQAQNDTIPLSSVQVEEIFIKQNLQLIVGKLDIDKADAAILQAKLWPNPTFTLDQVNFWATDAQRQGVDEVIPPISGSFGKNLEFGVGIDQLIRMGGKRRKLVGMEKVSKEMAMQYYEELLRSLKVELRSACATLRYSQQYGKLLNGQQQQLEALIANYRSQTAQGNVSQTQLLRLQAALLEVQSERNEVQKEINQQQKDLRVLLNISTPVYIQLTGEGSATVAPRDLSFGKLSDMAATQRPDLKRATLQTDYYQKSIRYEKAQRVPDLTFHASYDRGGNCMLNFIGFGVSVDLPFFDRNQGGIKSARIAHTQSLAEAGQKQTEVLNEVMQAMDNYRMAYEFDSRIAREFISDLEKMQESYARNLVSRNISVVEFLDFFDAYKENKRTMLVARRDACICYEELQYAVGAELPVE